MPEAGKEKNHYRLPARVRLFYTDKMHLVSELFTVYDNGKITFMQQLEK